MLELRIFGLEGQKLRTVRVVFEPTRKLIVGNANRLDRMTWPYPPTDDPGNTLLAFQRFAAALSEEGSRRRVNVPGREWNRVRHRAR